MKIGEQAIYLAQLKGMNRKIARPTKKWFEKFDFQIGIKVTELSRGWLKSSVHSNSTA